MKKFLRNRGFTLTEMIIVLGIIGVLFTIASGTYRTQRIQVEFNDSLTKIIGMMKTARNYAITSYQVEDGSNLYIPEEGYGIYINRSTREFILFANTSVTGNDAYRYDAGDIDQENYTLPNNTVFEGFLEDTESSSKVAISGDPQEIVILFRPPLADVEIANNNDISQTIETLYMKMSRSGAPDDADKYIRINRTAGFPELELINP